MLDGDGDGDGDDDDDDDDDEEEEEEEDSDDSASESDDLIKTMAIILLSFSKHHQRCVRRSLDVPAMAIGVPTLFSSQP